MTLCLGLRVMIAYALTVARGVIRMKKVNLHLRANDGGRKSERVVHWATL